MHACRAAYGIVYIIDFVQCFPLLNPNQSIVLMGLYSCGARIFNQVSFILIKEITRYSLDAHRITHEN